jgi:8-oxo-dGTP pyrophosphatase MutT (NUDIX family)
MRANTKCINGEEIGHSYSACKKPVKSFGFIAFNDKNEFLLIQRKDSIGYTDFLRGKYSNIQEVINLIEEMTNKEKYDIINKTFDELWDELWIRKNNGIYVREKTKAKRMFNNIDAKNLIKSSGISRYLESEFEFPKGRKKLNESDVKCAKREFEEETGLSYKDYTVLLTIRPIVEKFIGSDGIKYEIIYYIALLNNDIDFSAPKTTLFLEEVRQVVLLDYKKAYKKIRPYYTQKKFILTAANMIIKKMRNIQ